MSRTGYSKAKATLIICRALGLCALASIVCGGGSVLAEYPEKPIKLVVPTNAGGEIDGLARLLKREIEERDLLAEKLVILNIPGAGGTLGTRRIKQSKPDGYTLGFWSSGFVASRAMGIVDYDHTDFELICMSGYAELGLGVHRDSKFDTIETLVSYAKANPREVKFSTNIGLPTHFIPLLFAEQMGIEFSFIQTGGGSQRLTSILGRHTDVTLFANTAFLLFKEAGLKPLVTFSEKRDPLLPHIPTSKEVGTDFSLGEVRVWVAPKGTPQAALNTIHEAVRIVMEDPTVKESIRQFGAAPVFGGSEVCQPLLDELSDRIASCIKG